MCGIAGFWAPGSGPADREGVLHRMASTLQHRGPDDDGVFLDAGAGVGLAFRRLAILDLSVEGHQPMASASGRYVIVFNGEAYNFLELRRTLEQAGVRFRGGSDTEVLLAAFERWGVREAVQRCAGMFAFAVWDCWERALYLGRDRLGEKPLCYGWVGDTLVFGSELRALREYPGWQGQIDPGAVALYLRFNAVPAPYSIYHGVRKVAPGTVLRIRVGASGLELEEQAYWSALETARGGLANPLEGPAETIIQSCDELLRKVVAREMIADVPLGAFLSGGVDSSTIVALMQAQSTRPVRTFTIGFEDAAYDEAEHARAVATHLGTCHTELYVTEAEMLGAVSRMPAMYDEPFGDSSQIPTFLVARMAREHVTVSLSGDGGDELFAGYAHYGHGARLWRSLSRVPAGARRAAAGALAAVPSGMWDRVLARGGERVARFLPLLRADTLESMYGEVMSHLRDPHELLADGTPPPTIFHDPVRRLAGASPVERMMFLDLVGFLPDDILVKVDRATMAVSLESRAPLLDHTVAEFAWRVPLHLKRRDGRGKWLLREVLRRYVPDSIVDRPKMGFGVPVREWLAGPLREWSRDILTPARLRRDGFFRPEAVGRLWERQQAGESRREDVLWSLVMFHAWLDEQ